MAARLGGRAGLRRAQPRPRRGARREQDVRRRDAPVPLGRAPHGAHAQLHDRRRARAPAAPPRRPGAAPDGLRRLRPARRERRHPRGGPPAAGDRAQHRVDPRADAPHGVGDRLVARALDARARVLPLDAMALPAVLREGPRLPQGGARQVVPERPDRARQRTGHRRALRALWRRGRGQEPDTVVLQDH